MEQTEIELTQVADLRQSILDDVFKDFAHTRRKRVRSLLVPLVWLSANRFAGMAADLDNTISQHGLRQALCEFMASFVREVVIEENEHIPQDGSLLTVSNHPGAIDGIAIGVSLPREDHNVVTTDFPIPRLI